MRTIRPTFMAGLSCCIKGEGARWDLEDTDADRSEEQVPPAEGVRELAPDLFETF